MTIKKLMNTIGKRNSNGYCPGEAAVVCSGVGAVGGFCANAVRVAVRIRAEVNTFFIGCGFLYILLDK